MERPTPKNPSEAEAPKPPRKPRRIGRALGAVGVAAVIAIGGVVTMADSLDTGDHSAEVKQDLEGTLKPTTEDMGKKLIDFADSKKEDSNYSVSIFERPADENGNVFTDTTVSQFVSDGNFTSNQEYTVSTDSSGNIVGIRGSDSFQIGENPAEVSRFGITGPKDNSKGEWFGSAVANGTSFHTGDQGIFDSSGDNRSDTERAGDISSQAIGMVDSFTEAA